MNVKGGEIMQTQKLVKRDINHYHISKTALAHDLGMSRPTLYAKLGLSISPAFYNKVESSIGYLLHKRHMKYAKEDKSFNKEK